MLMTRLSRVWPHGTRLQKEDFLSECFAELLKEDNVFFNEFLGLIGFVIGEGDVQEYHVSTQHIHRDSRFDLFIRLSVAGQVTSIVIENKVDAALNEYEAPTEDGDGRKTINQIEKYLAYANDFDDYIVLYVGQSPVEKPKDNYPNARFCQLTWGQIAHFLSRNRQTYNRVEYYLRVCMIELLEDYGMGDDQLTATEIVGATRLWRFAGKVYDNLTVVKNSLPTKLPYDFAKVKRHQWSDADGYIGYYMKLPLKDDCQLAIVIRYNHHTIEPDIPDLQFHIQAHPATPYNKFLRSSYCFDLMEKVRPYCETHDIHGGQELEAKWRILNLRQSMKYVIGSENPQETIVGFYVGLYEELDRQGFWERLLEVDQDS